MVAVMLTVVLLVVVPGLAPPPPCSPIAKSADGVLSLGTLLPKTEGFVYTNPAMDAGAHLAIKDINDAGGIPGIAVTLDGANQYDEGDPSTDTASQSTDALKAGGVDAIIGTGRSAAALKVIDKVVCARMIMFAPGTTSPVFTTYQDHGLFFRTAPSNALEALLLGKLIVHDGNSTAVVVSYNDAYANPLREATEKAIRKSGGKVLDSFSYEPNVREYDTIVQRIKAKNPDAIVLIGFTESAQILAKMTKEGVGPKSKRVYGSDSNMTNTLASQVNRQHPGVLDLAAAVAGTDEPAAIAKEINDVTKTDEKCTSFATCMTLVKDRKDIDYDGPSGPLEFTDAGEPCSIRYMISEIQADGTVKSLGSEWASC